MEIKTYKVKGNYYCSVYIEDSDGNYFYSVLDEDGAEIAGLGSEKLVIEYLDYLNR